jgi:O-antigen/teichoic acid export membrane protein
MIQKLKSLQNHQGFMKYFKNTSWLFGEKILRMIVGLFVGIWVARYLGPEQFGLFSYAQSFVGLFTAIATLGLDGIVIRELVKDETRRDELIGTAFWLKVMGAFGVLLILAVAINFTSNDTHTNTLVFIIASATIFQSFNVVDMYFQSKVMSKYVVYANVISLFISSIVKIILILNEASLIAFAWVVLFDSFVLGFGLIYFYIKNNSTFKIQHLKFSKATAVALLKDSWPLIFAGIAISINMRIDQVMLKEFLGNESVGYYVAGIRVAEVLIFIPHLISKSIFPAFVKSYDKNNKEFNYRIATSYRDLFYISLFISIIIFNFSDSIILNTFGKEYLDSIYVLQIYSVSILLASIGSINAIYFKVKNIQKKIMIRQIYNIFLNIILNYVLIQSHGIAGAAYATIISAFFIRIVYDLFDKDLREMNKLKLNILFIKVKT